MKILAWLLIASLLGYAGLLALMYVFQRALLYFPDSVRPPAQAGLRQAQEVTLTSSDGEKLLAWFVPPRGDKPLVIYFQGNAEGLTARAGALQLAHRQRHRAAGAVLSRLWRLDRLVQAKPG